MTPLTAVKVSLAVAGLLLFGYGIRIDSSLVRWWGIAFVAAAAVLRFVGRRPGGSRSPGGDVGGDPGGA
jgi:hypothetical protein